MTTKKTSSKKEEPKSENNNKETIFNYIDNFSKGVKLGIADDTNNEFIKEQIDFIDAFVLDFKSTIKEDDNVNDILRFISEITSGISELMIKHKSSKKEENVENLEVNFSSQPKEKVAFEDEDDEIIDFKVSEFNIPTKETLLPYQIHIKNLTDEKLYDVDLFNYEHEKQNKIAYSCGAGVDYNNFLRFLSALSEAKEQVKLLRVQVWCDYPKFRNKQLNCCLHRIITNPNGCLESVALQVGNYFMAYQHQSDIIDIPMTDDNKIELFNELQLRLSYLMPETEMIITIFPSTIIK